MLTDSQRESGEGPVDALRQGTERTRVARREPEHVVAEPVGVVELAGTATQFRVSR